MNVLAICDLYFVLGCGPNDAVAKRGCEDWDGAGRVADGRVDARELLSGDVRAIVGGGGLGLLCNKTGSIKSSAIGCGHGGLPGGLCATWSVVIDPACGGRIKGFEVLPLTL